MGYASYLYFIAITRTQSFRSIPLPLTCIPARPHRLQRTNFPGAQHHTVSLDARNPSLTAELRGILPGRDKDSDVPGPSTTTMPPNIQAKVTEPGDSPAEDGAWEGGPRTSAVQLLGGSTRSGSGSDGVGSKLTAWAAGGGDALSPRDRVGYRRRIVETSAEHQVSVISLQRGSRWGGGEGHFAPRRTSPASELDRGEGFRRSFVSCVIWGGVSSDRIPLFSIAVRLFFTEDSLPRYPTCWYTFLNVPKRQGFSREENSDCPPPPQPQDDR